jgi:hypothetical protein
MKPRAKTSGCEEEGGFTMRIIQAREFGPGARIRRKGSFSLLSRETGKDAALGPEHFRKIASRGVLGG